jgi:hypothetical protein
LWLEKCSCVTGLVSTDVSKETDTFIFEGVFDGPRMFLEPQKPQQTLPQQHGITYHNTGFLSNISAEASNLKKKQ